MTYLRNAWYLAAWAAELEPARPLARTICDMPLVFFRTEDGAAALHDACPHRFAPLSRGRMADGALHCGYHGLAFDRDGRCIHNPHGPVPNAARVRSLPVAERHAALWIWPGDPAAADPALIPDLGFIDRTRPEARASGYLRTAANYLLMVDNILDLSHADFLHPDTLGGGINTRTRGVVADTADGLSIKWHADGERLPPLMDASLPTPGAPADFRNDVYWSPPGVMRQRVTFSPAGRIEAPTVDSWTAHVMTPETAGSTHYFYCHTSDALNRDPSLAPATGQVLRGAFEGEDAPMIAAQQSRIDGADFWSLKPVLLSIDGAAARARRRLDQMIAAEHADGPAARAEGRST